MRHSTFVHLGTNTSPPINLEIFPLSFPVSTHYVCACSLVHLNSTGFPYDWHVLTSTCCRHWAEPSFLTRKCSHFSTKLQTTILNGMQDVPGLFFLPDFSFFAESSSQRTLWSLRLNSAMKCYNAYWAMLKMLASSQLFGKLLCTSWSPAPP